MRILTEVLRMKLAWILLACASLSGLGAPVEDDAAAPGPDATLAECLDYAERHNPAIRAANARWRAAREKAPQAEGWPDPKVSYGYFLENVETRVGPQEHRIGVTQALPWFGKLKAAGDVADAEAAEAFAEWTAARLRVFRDIKDAWFELAWLEQAQGIAADNIELLSQLEGVAQTRLKSGGSLGPVTRAQVELGKLQDRLATLEDMRGPLGAELNSLLGRPADTSFPSPRSIGRAEIFLPDLGQLLAWQAEANPLLEKLAHSVHREEHAIRLAKKQGRPEFGLGVDYIVTGGARMPGVTDSGKDAVIGMFSMSIPLWRGKYRAMEREAEARREAAEAALNDQGNRLGAMLEMAHFRFRDSERKINLYSATLLPQARSALSVAQQNYESGAAEFLNLIDSQRVLLDFELEHQRALANRQQALAEIEMLVGRALGRPEGESLGEARKD